MNDYVKSDLMRYYGKYDRLTFIRAYLTNRVFRFQYALRLCQCTGFAKLIGVFLYYISPTRRAIQIPRDTKIGYGLYIGHAGPVIVNPSAVIGNNCNLSQFTTIGSNVTIGAGSVVTKDIPDNATAVGNYAKVVNYNNPGRYILNPWKVEE